MTRSLALKLALALLVTPLIARAEEGTAVPTDDGTSITAALPVQVALSDPGLRYSGRFEKKEAGAAICAWSASAVTLRFKGTTVAANLGVGGNRVEVILDGKPVKILTGRPSEAYVPAPTPQLYSLAAGLPNGEHTVTLFKCTEAGCGNVTFLGFQLAAGSAVLPVTSSSRKIEVVGDSISAGYGNEGLSEKERFSPATENAYWTYGAIASRALGADYTCIAWSGRTLWPDFSIPEVFDRTLPRDPASLWSGDMQKPDVILINLCTNDFGRKVVPDEEKWVEAYHQFIAHLRKDAPGATLYCAHGPMLTDFFPPGAKAATKAHLYIQRVVKEENDRGDAKVHYLEFETQNRGLNGIGSDWHPSVRTHQIMAAKFLGVLQHDLGWALSQSRSEAVSK